MQPEPVVVTPAVKDALTRLQATFLGRLKAQDVDQEVKETAIQCQGTEKEIPCKARVARVTAARSPRC